MPQAHKGHMTREEIVAFFERRQVAYDNFDAGGVGRGLCRRLRRRQPYRWHAHGASIRAECARSGVRGVSRHENQNRSPAHRRRPCRAVLSVEGTNIGGFLGLEASGKPFRLAAVFVYEFKDRQIVRERRIYDFTGMLTQIGVLKTKPV